MTVTSEIGCGPASIEVEASVGKATRPSGFDPGDGGEIQIERAWRNETEPHKLGCGIRHALACSCGRRTKQVPISLDSLHAVLGDAGWAALEEQIWEQAADQDDGPDPDDARDREMDR